MILIRSIDGLEYSDLASFPKEIEALLESVPGWTEIGSDVSTLDGQYTASDLRAIAFAMEWHAQHEQQPIVMMTEAKVCGDCTKPVNSDAFIAVDGSVYCFKDAQK